MIVVLEGIDGAGKSTIAPLLLERLAPAYPSARLLDKRGVFAGNPAAARHLEQLRTLIWRRDELESDVLGARHWLALIAAWYQALDRCCLKTVPADQLVVVDGWFYRNLVKTGLRLGSPPSEFLPLFSGIERPDRVMLIDVEPSIAWERREAFKRTELGRWDGHNGDDRNAFIGYQQRVRGGLLELGVRWGWQIFRRARESSPLEVAAQLFEGWRSEERRPCGSEHGHA